MSPVDTNAFAAGLGVFNSLTFIELKKEREKNREGGGLASSLVSV